MGLKELVEDFVVVFVECQQIVDQVVDVVVVGDEQCGVGQVLDVFFVVQYEVGLVVVGLYCLCVGCGVG